MAKQFRDTKVGKLLQSKGLDKVLDIAGEVVPGIGILNKVKDAVLENKLPELQVLTEQERAEIVAAAQQHLNELDMMLKDVQNARQREVEVTKAGGSNIIMYIIALLVVGAFYVMVFAIVRNGIPEMSEQAAFIMGNVTGTCAMMALAVVNYFFSSTVGSRIKDAMVERFANKR